MPGGSALPDNEVVDPFLVKYDGKDADRHVLQADKFGRSVLGGARLYTAVAHYCFFGFVPQGNYRRSFTCYAVPTRPGSVDQWLFIAPLVAGDFALHSAIYKAAFGYIFRKVCDGILSIWTKPKDSQRTIDQLIASLQKNTKMDADVQAQLIALVAQGQSDLAGLHRQLIETLPALAASTRPHGVNLVAPVGKSCRTVKQFADTPDEATITEADAEVIRGAGDLEVDAMDSFRVNRIRELNLTTGHCILDVEGIGQVRGKITDPSLEQPNNVYTSALDDHAGCTVEAKAVRKDGAVHRLFISDATR